MNEGCVPTWSVTNRLLKSVEQLLRRARKRNCVGAGVFLIECMTENIP